MLVNLDDKSATLDSEHAIGLPAVQKILSGFSKYSGLDFSGSNMAKNLKSLQEVTLSKFITYKPLIVLFSYVF